MFKAVLLGSVSSKPTKENFTSSMLLQYGGDAFLFDVCEGAQIRIMQSGISFMKINCLFVSHFHADHFLGIPGLLATMELSERKSPLTIFGPKGIKSKIDEMLKIFNIGVSYKLICKEIKDGKILDLEKAEVYAKKVNHRVQNFGFVFKEKDKVGEFNRKKAEKLLPPGPLYKKLQDGETVTYNGKKIKPEMVMDYSKKRIGKKVSYFVDLYDKGYEKFIENSDLLFHESCFMKNEEKKAKETKHSVLEDVIKISKKAKVKKLVLFNYSNRYLEDRDKIKKQLKSKEIEFGNDLDSFELK
jgi:ribonuclease Z